MYICTECKLEFELTCPGCPDMASCPRCESVKVEETS